ncbi:MAG: hypothetical protein A2W25_04195 [candidate division Zixibacteria bacterium RBG_16_53_22]|nr:MAG: hypothetical protein A2W25_04195 [candidate division Zixibacteria bacterium RBG_16_53_22]
MSVQHGSNPKDTPELKHVIDGHIKNDDEMWYIQLIFALEGDDPAKMSDWVAHLTISNTTQIIPMPVFLELCKVLGDVHASAKIGH